MSRLTISVGNGRIDQRVLTEMKAVFSIVTRGTISMSCSDAINSSSGGVTDVLSDCGRAIGLGVMAPSAAATGSLGSDRGKASAYWRRNFKRRFPFPSK